MASAAHSDGRDRGALFRVLRGWAFVRLESVGGSSSLKAMVMEEEGDVTDRSRKKVRKGGGGFSGDVLLKPRVEVWIEDDSPKKEQPNYKESLMKNIAPSWCDLDEELIML